MKRFLKLIPLAIAILFGFASCNLGGEEDFALRFTNAAGHEDTLLEVQRFELTLLCYDGEGARIDVTTTGDFNITEMYVDKQWLYAGTWNYTLDGFNGDGTKVCANSGQFELAGTRGEDSVDIVLDYLYACIDMKVEVAKENTTVSGIRFIVSSLSVDTVESEYSDNEDGNRVYRFERLVSPGTYEMENRLLGTNGGNLYQHFETFTLAAVGDVSTIWWRIPKLLSPVSFNINSGIHNYGTDLVFTPDNPSCSMRYIVDNGDNWIDYTGPITLTRSCTFKAYCSDYTPNFSCSDFSYITVIIRTPTPLFFPSDNSITLIYTQGSTVYYTLDGSTPNQSSNVYTGPVPFTSGTFKAVAYIPDCIASYVISYTI